MKKNLFITFIALFLFATQIQAQNSHDNAAGGREISDLIVIPEKIKEKLIETKKDIPTTLRVSKTTKEIKAEKKQIRQQKRTEKFLKSKFGQWYFNKIIKKAEKKRLKKELKNATPEQAQILKEQSEERVKKLQGNMRTGVILIVVGVLLVVLGGAVKDGGIFYVLGTIGIIIGLILVLLELI